MPKIDFFKTFSGSDFNAFFQQEHISTSFIISIVSSRHFQQMLSAV